MSEVVIGQVVLIADAGALIPMRVAGQEGSRVLAIDDTGNERWLATKRIFWISSHILQEKETIEPYWNKIQSSSQDMDLQAQNPKKERFALIFFH